MNFDYGMFMQVVWHIVALAIIYILYALILHIEENNRLLHGYPQTNKVGIVDVLCVMMGFSAVYIVLYLIVYVPAVIYNAIEFMYM